MYRDVAKRVLAVVLAFCMVGSMPDITLLAETGRKTVQHEADLNQEEPAANDENSETLEENLTETAFSLETEVSQEPEDTPETENTEAPAGNLPEEQGETGINPAAGKDAQDTSDTISLSDSRIEKPGKDEVPNQVRGSITDGFVTVPVVGLVIKDGDVTLQQIMDESSAADGYKVRAVLKDNGRTAQLTVEGSGKYTGALIYQVSFGDDITQCTVELEYADYGPGTTNFYYEGQPIVPKVTIKTSDNRVLAENDYSLTFENNVNVGNAHILIRGKGSYAGERTADFTILQARAQTLFTVELKNGIYNKARAASQDGILPSEVKVTNNKTKQPASPQDYHLSYSNNKSVTNSSSPAILTVRGTGNCEGSFEADYQVERASLNDAAYAPEDKIIVELDPSYSLSYTGMPLEPPVIVYQGDSASGRMVKDTDYTVSYSNNVNVGTGKVVLAGLDNYIGTREVPFTIGKLNIKDIDSSQIHVDDCEYTGSRIEPNIPNTLTDKAGHLLTKGTDYKVEFANNTNVGNGIVRIMGIGNCTGELDVYFVIYKNMESPDIRIGEIAGQPYSGKALYPVPEIRDNGTLLKKDRDFTLEYNPADPVNRDTYEIIITGDGTYYRGTAKTEFQIVRRDMSTMEVQFVRPVPDNTYTFSGSPIMPDIRVVDKSDGTVLPIGDFDVVYTDKNGGTSPTGAGDCLVTVTPKAIHADNYSDGSVTLSYTIAPKAMSEGRNFTLKLDGQDTITPAYTGSDIEPAVTVFDNRRDAATGAESASGGYLVPASDYSVTYSNNRNAGTATVTVTGRNNYSGSITKNFRILPLDFANVSQVQITLSPDQTYVFTGSAVVPIVSELLVDGRPLRADEFTVSSEAVNVGTNNLFTIRGTGNYTGSIRSDAAVVANAPIAFDILPQDIAAIDVQLEPIPNQSHTGGPLTPVPVMTYNGYTLSSADFTLDYKNNTDLDHNTTDPALMPTVTITGKGNFTGTRTAYFHICESIAGAVVEGLDDIKYSFTSREQKPVPSKVTLNGKELEPGIDYSVSYKNNINAAASTSAAPPTVVINGMGEYGGSVEKTFTIEPVIMVLDKNGNLSAPLTCTVGSSPMFTGSPVRPTVTLKHNVTDPVTGERFVYLLEEGKDFEFEKSQNINVANAAKYSLRVRPIGNYKVQDGYSAWVPISKNGYTIKAKPITAEEISIEIGEFDETKLPAQPPVKITDTRRSSVDGSYVESGGTYTLQPGTTGDYTVTYKNNVAPGTASIVITGRGNYSASVTKTFLIPGNLSNAQVDFLDPTDPGGDSYYLFTGSAITPKIRVTCGQDASGSTIELKNGTDYEFVINGDNTNCGEPEIELVGKGAYEGSTRRVTFRITPRDLTDASVKINVPGSVDYNEGKNVEPAPSIMLGRYTLTEGVDYKCVYENPCSMPSNISGKKYKIEIQAINGGNFKGKAVREYAIGNNFNVEITFDDGSSGTYTYTGFEIIPKIKVKDKSNGNILVQGKDYDMSYAPGNINVGKVTLTVFGLGEPGNDETQYCGSRDVTFTIAGKNLADSDIEIGDIEDYIYTSEAIMPEPQVVWKEHAADKSDVVLTAGEDFKYTYTSNIDAGTGTVRIEPVSANSNFSGQKEKTFRILKKNIEDEDVTIDNIPDQVYIGNAITPKLNIHWGTDAGRQVTLNADDYELSYGEEGNVEVGTVEVTIKGKGNYEGTITTTFRIVKVKLSDITAEYSKEEQYTGKQIKPDIKLTYQSTDGEIIEMNAPEVWGYEITYGSNQLLGTTSGTITVTADPNGNCEGGPLELHFAIIKRHLDDSTIQMTGIEDSYTFNPDEAACEPEPTLTFKPDAQTTYTLRKGYDYTVKYEGNTTVNQAAKIIVTGIGNFDRSLEKTFRITKDLLDYIVSASVDPTPLVYNGQAQHPKVNIEFKTNDIEEGRDYELVWDEDCINAGEHTVTIHGIGDYGGDMPLTFTIGKRDISHVSVEISDYEYTGSEIDPYISVTDPDISDATLGGDVYVIMGIASNKEIGTATVTIEAVETSNYVGSKTATFEITPVDLGSGRITSTVVDSPQDYTGSPVTPEFTVTDTRRNAAGDAISEEDGESYYVLKEGSDYTVEYTDNIYPGVTPATITITGIGSYAGTLTKIFDIRADLSYAVIEPIPAQAYTGEAVTPELTVTLGEKTLQRDLDYTVQYSNNIERGTATATIYPVEGSLYTGSNEANFVISRDIAGADVTLESSEFVYTGSEIRPDVTVVFEGNELTEGTDYTVTYEDNIDVGTATLIITGTGGYDGSVRMTFIIKSREITGAEIQLIDSKFTYNGSAITPQAAVVLGDIILREGVDYEITYENNVNVGTAGITVTGIGGNVGTIRKTFEIVKRNITRCTFGNITDKIFLGTPTYQDLVVTDSGIAARAAGGAALAQNRDYTLTYENNAAPGVATLTVSGMGNYGGTKPIRYLVNFTDMTAVTANAAADSVTLSWGAVPGAEGYGIYDAGNNLIARTEGLSYIHAGLDALTTYSYKVRPYKSSGQGAYYGNFSNTAQAATGIMTPKISLKAGKKRIRVSWNRIKGVSGYEISRSTKKKKGYRKIKTAQKGSVVSYTNKGLTKKKKYYYKVRAYKNVNGRKVYSSYSSVKSVKAK